MVLVSIAAISIIHGTNVVAICLVVAAAVVLAIARVRDGQSRGSRHRFWVPRVKETTTGDLVDTVAALWADPRAIVGKQGVRSAYDGLGGGWNAKERRRTVRVRSLRPRTHANDLTPLARCHLDEPGNRCRNSTPGKTRKIGSSKRNATVATSIAANRVRHAHTSPGVNGFMAWTVDVGLPSHRLHKGF